MKKILVIRNDKIGDFMLAWPSFAMLKLSIPDCNITALVPQYTAKLAELCPWIDHIIIDPTKNSSKDEQVQLLADLKARKFDYSINLFSTMYNALLVWRAGISYRLAPATKLAQIFYNHRVKQKRSLSLKPEYQYNLDLIRAFLTENNIPIIEPQAPYLTFAPSKIAAQKDKLAQLLNINITDKWFMLHIGTGGSSNNLSTLQYAKLIQGIHGDFQLIITAGNDGEETQAKHLDNLLTAHKVVIYSKNDGLIDFTTSLACADLFIAGSTGPLHIAATLDVPTIGFFPNKRSSTPLRWQPLNSATRHLAFCPPEGINDEQSANMSRVNIGAALEKINPWIAKF